MLNSTPNTFSRHDLVWIELDAVRQAQYVGPAPLEAISALSLLHRWVLGNYPLIVARQEDTPAGLLRVGLAEPHSWGKRRLGFLVGLQGITRHQPGPLLSEVATQLPAPWQAGLAALVAGLQEIGVPAHVYGSSAIEVLTGLPCITENSDLDLLFKPVSWQQVQSLSMLLNALRLNHPALRIDGEVSSPAGHAVSWQELAMQSEQMLVKSSQQVQMMSLKEFQHQFDQQSSPVRSTV